MRIVSETSAAELARRRALEDVDEALKELAANIMRVSRGAGKPYDLGKQAQSLVVAMIAYKDAVGYYPSSEELTAPLAHGYDEERLDRMSDDHRATAYAEEAMVRGALQIAASRLLGQRTQESAGHSEMYKGLNEIVGLREKRRREEFVSRDGGRRLAQLLRRGTTKRRKVDARD